MDSDELHRLKSEHPERTELIEPLLNRMYSPKEASEWLYTLLTAKPEESYPMIFRLFHEGFSLLYERLFSLRCELLKELGDESLGEVQREVIQDSLQTIRSYLSALESAREIFLMSA